MLIFTFSALRKDDTDGTTDADRLTPPRHGTIRRCGVAFLVGLP
jgi:hypothetical protein